MELDSKTKLTRYLEREGIGSVLNDTKWRRLFEELQNFEGALQFQRKDVDEAEPNQDYWDSDIYHVFGAWQKIEWLNVRALTVRRRGALVKPEIEDKTPMLIDAVRRAGVPYCMNSSGVRIWGYLRPGVSPEWAGT